MAFKIDLDPNSELETVGFQDGYGPDGHGPDGQGWPSGAALNCFDLRCEGMMGGQQMGMGMKGMQAPSFKRFQVCVDLLRVACPWARWARACRRWAARA